MRFFELNSEEEAKKRGANEENRNTSLAL